VDSVPERYIFGTGFVGARRGAVGEECFEVGGGDSQRTCRLSPLKGERVNVRVEP
jgi:hypothetical protein